MPAPRPMPREAPDAAPLAPARDRWARLPYAQSLPSRIFGTWAQEADQRGWLLKVEKEKGGVWPLGLGLQGPLLGSWLWVGQRSRWGE